jgi:hypothetical protein
MCRPQGDFRSLGAVLFGMPHRPHIIPASKVAISKSVHQQAFPIGPISPLLSPFFFKTASFQLFSTQFLRHSKLLSILAPLNIIQRVGIFNLMAMSRHYFRRTAISQTYY